MARPIECGVSLSLLLFSFVVTLPETNRIVRRNSIALVICFDLIRTQVEEEEKKMLLNQRRHKFTRTHVTPQIDGRTNTAAIKSTLDSLAFCSGNPYEQKMLR